MKFEVTSIHRDFNIVFQDLEEEYRCAPEDKSNLRLAAYNIFRLLKDTVKANMIHDLKIVLLKLKAMPEVKL